MSAANASSSTEAWATVVLVDAAVTITPGNLRSQGVDHLLFQRVKESTGEDNRHGAKIDAGERGRDLRGDTAHPIQCVASLRCRTYIVEVEEVDEQERASLPHSCNDRFDRIDREVRRRCDREWPFEIGL